MIDISTIKYEWLKSKKKSNYVQWYVQAIYFSKKIACHFHGVIKKSLKKKGLILFNRIILALIIVGYIAWLN